MVNRHDVHHLRVDLVIRADVRLTGAVVAELSHAMGAVVRGDSGMAEFTATCDLTDLPVALAWSLIHRAEDILGRGAVERVAPALVSLADIAERAGVSR